MKIQNFDLIKAEDFVDLPAEQRRVIERLAERINPHLDIVTTALQNNQTWADNSNAEIRTINMCHDVEKQVSLQTLRGRPRHALVLSTAIYDYARLAWRIINESVVGVKVKFDSAPTGEFDVEIVFLGN